jgi:hypothetical protein
MNTSRSIALCVVVAALLVFVCLVLNAGFAGVDAQQPPGDGQCRGKRDGSPCRIAGLPACNVARCRASTCDPEPAPAGTSCPDTDGNPCTVARCSAEGRCDQRSRLRPDGTVCSDATPGCGARGQTCSAGKCLPTAGSGDPSQVARVSVEEVQVTAQQPRVEQATSFNDCCGGIFHDCEEQNLEALVPTNLRPTRVERDGGLPLRRKFCGIVTKYEVNDERADPRDMNFNIRPVPGSSYVDFLRGFVQTADADYLTDQDRRLFGKGDCDPGACLARALDPGLTEKIMHAEVTPDEHFYGQDGRFLPIEGSTSRCVSGPFSTPTNLNCVRCIDGANCKSELEPGEGQTPQIEACVYGVFAYDHGLHKPSTHTELCCFKDSGHDHPEIHPYDAIWWRNPAANGWMFGVFQDDSNRYSFPHCRESQSNGNTWSQAPRDLTFEFPFRFPRRSAIQRVCLRHVRTTRLRDGGANIVAPLNVTTSEFAGSEAEVTALVIGRERLLELVKEPGTARETHVRIVGGFDGNDVVGRIILRVAVGCDQRTQACGRPTGPRDHRTPLFDRLKPITNLVQFDKDDPGAGYFYAELTFNCDCR